MKPVIALIGRPNVGKSTLFNRLTRSRDALVADLPGLTRDRHYGEGRVGERPLVIDTGGFEPVAKEGIMHEMAKQTKQAVAEADVVIFLVDGRQFLKRIQAAVVHRLFVFHQILEHHSAVRTDFPVWNDALLKLLYQKWPGNV